MNKNSHVGYFSCLFYFTQGMLFTDFLGFRSLEKVFREFYTYNMHKEHRYPEFWFCENNPIWFISENQTCCEISSCNEAKVMFFTVVSANIFKGISLSFALVMSSVANPDLMLCWPLESVFKTGFFRIPDLRHVFLRAWWQFWAKKWSIFFLYLFKNKIIYKFVKFCGYQKV